MSKLDILKRAARLAEKAETRLPPDTSIPDMLKNVPGYERVVLHEGNVDVDRVTFKGTGKLLIKD